MADRDVGVLTGPNGPVLVGTATSDTQSFGPDGPIGTYMPSRGVWDQPSIAEHTRDGSWPGDPNRGPGLFDSAYALVLQLKAQGYTAFRFELPWQRIEPTEGHYNEAAWSYYQNLAQLCVDNGIRPIVCLSHFNMPQWVDAHGGMRWHGIVGAFGGWVEEAARRLGPCVDDWIIMNEPNSYANLGYFTGQHHPFEKNVFAMMKAVRVQLRMIGAACDRLKTACDRLNASQPADRPRDWRYGPSIIWRKVIPHNPRSPLDRITAMCSDHFFNRIWHWALKTGREPFTALGWGRPVPGLKITQYFMQLYPPLPLQVFRLDERPQAVDTPLSLPNGWAVDAAGIQKHMAEVGRDFRVPVMISETGVPGTDVKSDNLRMHWVADVLAAIVRSGVPITGFLLWTIGKDVPEWHQGLWEGTDFNYIGTRSARMFDRIARNGIPNTGDPDEMYAALTRGLVVAERGAGPTDVGPSRAPITRRSPVPRPPSQTPPPSQPPQELPGRGAPRAVVEPVGGSGIGL